MKLLIVLVFCFYVKADVIQTDLSDSCGFEILSEIYDSGCRDNEDDVTNEDNFVKPCDNDDYNCIREFMADNSNCKPVYGPVPDPVCLSQSAIHFPNDNVTYSFAKATVTGLNKASVHSFYYNKKTKALVFAIKIPTLGFEIPEVTLTFRRHGLEPICKSDYANATIRSLIFTAIIPKVDGKLRFDLLDAIHGYVGDSTPDFYIGPKAYTSTDPTVKAAYASFLKTLPLDERTSFLYISDLFISLYIQKYICDFGVEIYSV